jgi:hypothetical protein
MGVGQDDFIMSSYFIEIMDYELGQRAEKHSAPSVTQTEKFGASAQT